MYSMAPLSMASKKYSFFQRNKQTLYQRQHNKRRHYPQRNHHLYLFIVFAVQLLFFVPIWWLYGRLPTAKHDQLCSSSIQHNTKHCIEIRSKPILEYSLNRKKLNKRSLSWKRHLFDEIDWNFALWSHVRRNLDYHLDWTDEAKPALPVPGSPFGNMYYLPSSTFVDTISRKDRFPTVQERIEYYMGDFYYPPRDQSPTNNILGESYRKQIYGQLVNTLYIQKGFENFMIDSVMINPMHRNYRNFIECSEFKTIPTFYHHHHHHEKIEEPIVLKANYCRDSVDLMLLWDQFHVSAPLLIHYKDFIPILNQNNIDAEHFYNSIDFPLFNKVRDLTNGEAVRGGAIPDGIPYSCILWPLNRRRHLVEVGEVIANDVPWEQKTAQMIWRGGINVHDPKTLNVDPSFSGPLQRWLLVNNHQNSNRINAKYYEPYLRNDGFPQNVIDGHEIPLKELLSYKYLISIEGHDISSGLKWMLFSNSCVFLPPPSWTSWAMESLLEPFVHYIPIHADMTNVEEMITWADEHPSKAKEIALRGKLFIYDLLFHPDAVRDEELILQGIVQRYEENYGYKSVFPNALNAYRQLSQFYTDNYLYRMRHARFPSWEERVQYYLGHWANRHSPCMMPACLDNSANSIIRLHEDVIIRSTNLKSCLSPPNPDPILKAYCEDSLPDFNPNKDRHMREEVYDIHNLPSKIVHFGDSISIEAKFPVFVERRINPLYDNDIGDNTVGRRASLTEHDRINGVKGILWPFLYEMKHRIVLSDLVVENDISFDAKTSKAFWRGGSGIRRQKADEDQSQSHLKLMDLELIRRLDFVRKNSLNNEANGESLVNAQFDASVKDETKSNAASDELNIDYNYIDENPMWLEYRDTKHMEDANAKLFQTILSFKYLMFLDGTDRGNHDLSWMLLSNSVVFMPRNPKFVTWLMEDKLEPFVHYVPIAHDLSNVDEMVRWCERNPEKSLSIMRQSTLYINDLFFHPSSDDDNMKIRFEIMHFYNWQFSGSK